MDGAFFPKTLPLSPRLNSNNSNRYSSSSSIIMNRCRRNINYRHRTRRLRRWSWNGETLRLRNVLLRRWRHPRRHFRERRYEASTTTGRRLWYPQHPLLPWEAYLWHRWDIRPTWNIFINRLIIIIMLLIISIIILSIRNTRTVMKWDRMRSKRQNLPRRRKRCR